MKAKDIRTKSKDELTQLLDELAVEQFNLRMQKGMSQLANSARIKEVRKSIARVKTLMAESDRS